MSAPSGALYTYGTVGHWGVWDTVLSVWIGTDKGPLTYEDRSLAQVAAQVFNNKFGYFEQLRLQVRQYDDTGNRLRDYVDPIMDGLRALRIAEGDEPMPARPRRRRREP